MNTLVELNTLRTSVDWLQVLEAGFQLAQPAVSVLVPAVLAAIAHRFVKNREMADQIASAGAAAYSHLAEVYASNHKADLQSARSEAIGVGAMVLKQLAVTEAARLTDDQVKAKVGGALGALLAADPAFNVLAPDGKPISAAA